MTYQKKKRSAWRLCWAIVAAILLQAGPLFAQSYTLAPAVFASPLDGNGRIVVGGCIWTYAAGTTTPIATYSTSAGAVNSNPIIVDANGRYVAYLLSGTSYKFLYETACTPPAHGTVLATQDNIAGLPASAANVDILGVAGEAITVGQCVYLSDGSGSKTAGQWFKCDSANAYSATAPEVGLAVNAISAAATGTIRIAGTLTGLSSLSVGGEYFVGTSGAMTATAPTLARHLGHADTVTSFVFTGNPSVPTPVDNGLDDFRLTLTSGTPVTTSDVTAATTIYLTPQKGNRIALYSSTGVATIYTSAEISIAVPATTSQMYDVFGVITAGVPALELLAWTNDTTRATAIVLTTTGAYTKSGDLTRRYLGSVRTTTVSGQTEDSAAKRYLWNYYNRARRVVRKTDSTATWPYTVATWRQANGAAANQIDVVQGVAEGSLWLQLTAAAGSSSGGGAGVHLNIGIGEDSTSSPDATAIAYINIFTASTQSNAIATLNKVPAVGRHFYAWLEGSEAVGTTTWLGTNNAIGATTTASGLSGLWES